MENITRMNKFADNLISEIEHSGFGNADREIMKRMGRILIGHTDHPSSVNLIAKRFAQFVAISHNNLNGINFRENRENNIHMITLSSDDEWIPVIDKEEK